MYMIVYLGVALAQVLLHSVCNRHLTARHTESFELGQASSQSGGPPQISSITSPIKPASLDALDRVDRRIHEYLRPMFIRQCA